MAQQATAPSRAAQASKVADLARFFPDATPVRIPVHFCRTTNSDADQSTARGVQESTVIEFGTPREVLFACATPLEFADILHLRNSDGSLDAEASVVAVQYHPGTTAVAARFYQLRPQLDHKAMTPPPSETPTPNPNPAKLWANIQRIYPIYADLAREFAVDLPDCADLESGTETPAPESIEQAELWLQQMDAQVQVHQLRQFLQTSSVVNPDSIVALIQHLLENPAHSDSMRDKIDFLLVQYFSQIAPAELEDNRVDLAYVAGEMRPVLGKVELKTPVWLNALDRVLEAARKCRSLDELLHGGVLEQGRKAKAQAGDLFYLPVALVAFTRFGYLMRRSFFRLMLADLNGILDGLTELEEKGVETIDCRRAQFSAQEPVVRLRMICQSWKVMFQAEYSSGQPLRMLTDLRASVETALGRGTNVTGAAKNAGSAPGKKPASVAVAAGASAKASSPAVSSASSIPKPAQAASKSGTPEFEISATPGRSPAAKEQK